MKTEAEFLDIITVLNARVLYERNKRPRPVKVDVDCNELMAAIWYKVDRVSNPRDRHSCLPWDIQLAQAWYEYKTQHKDVGTLFKAAQGEKPITLWGMRLELPAYMWERLL